MSLAAHRFERVKFWIFVLIFFHSACLKKTATNICYSKFKLKTLLMSYRGHVIKMEIAFFVSEKWNQISIEVDGSGNIGNHEQFHGKIWRLVLWYKLITCFHKFCNYKSTIFFIEFYLFTFLWGRMFWLRANYWKKIIDLYKTFPENWARKQSFFVLILTMA